MALWSVTASPRPVMVDWHRARCWPTASERPRDPRVWLWGLLGGSVPIWHTHLGSFLGQLTLGCRAGGWNGRVSYALLPVNQCHACRPAYSQCFWMAVVPLTDGWSVWDSWVGFLTLKKAQKLCISLWPIFWWHLREKNTFLEIYFLFSEAGERHCPSFPALMWV